MIVRSLVVVRRTYNALTPYIPLKAHADWGIYRLTHFSAAKSIDEQRAERSETWKVAKYATKSLMFIEDFAHFGHFLLHVAIFMNLLKKC